LAAADPISRQALATNHERRRFGELECRFSVTRSPSWATIVRPPGGDGGTVEADAPDGTEARPGRFVVPLTA
jgi:hypothetical protein